MGQANYRKHQSVIHLPKVGNLAETVNAQQSYSLSKSALLTMTLKELESQLLALTPAEKAQAIQLLVQSLSSTWKGIGKTPGVCGGDACIANTRVPVWVLVNARRLGISEAELLSDYATLSATDLANAWAYAEAYPDEIEIAIRRNEED